MAGLACPALAAVPSLGCGRPPPVPAPASFAVGGVERRAIVAVPGGYRPDRPVPLALAFHGRTNDNARLRRCLGLEQAAAAPAIFVYPAALRDRAGGFTPDVALFDRILDDMGRSYCIDRSGVFLVGHSSGATFANSLACTRATVAGGIGPGRCTGHVPAILLHDPRDELVPLAEGGAGAGPPPGRADAGELAGGRNRPGLRVPARRRRAGARTLVPAPPGRHPARPLRPAPMAAGRLAAGHGLRRGAEPLTRGWRTGPRAW
jgi:hypothetical protein